MSELETIYIRAQIGGKWDSYSLQELYEIGTPEAYTELIRWITNKALDLVGIPEGTQLTPDVMIEAIHRLEMCGSTIYKLKN